MQTRSQQHSKLAYEHISRISQDESNGWSENETKQYGALCHRFPILVLRSGLAQAVAFVSIKAAAGKKPYQTFLKHLSIIVSGESQEFAAFQQQIHRMALADYQRATRRVLDAAVWYKRFAVSLLKVEAGDTDD
ncbi:MAG: type III-B CRISPR module-associated protein Cmr5 [Methylobacter sp.]|nr:MAG: type III-B CRISPR module-associated protein Cmr5 [Methylobacter sp.]PPD18698.1 MAG: type III-B CRISPR module-associated protein Cmr5 [Methylobacter sp.]PPD32296.1 MAG: type III-B CRISPR module-associated protein Cmr5 [Methylomonas sp.]